MLNSNAYEETQIFDKNFPFKIAISDHPTFMSAHWHNSIELMYFYDTVGCEYTVKNKQYKIKKGDLIIANPLESHTCADFGNASVCCIIISPDILDTYKGVLFFNHIKLDNRISQIFNKLRSQKESECFPFLSASFIYELIALLLSDYIFDNESMEKRTRYQPTVEKTEKIIKYIKDNYEKDIRIFDIANSLNLSESRVSHIFKEVTGMSIAEYVEHTRLSYAKVKLEELNLSITEIALSCGYCDHSYFSYRFRRKYGISPTAYRKQYRA